MTKKHTQYTLEFKQSSAKLARESEQSIAQVARDLGVTASALYGWVSKYEPMDKPTQELDKDAELARLRKENARLKMERDILKKATAYFASSGE
jgi:transposase